MDKLDIVAITKSWTKQNILHSEISFDGYDLYRTDRINTRVGSNEDILMSVKSFMVSLAVNVQ